MLIAELILELANQLKLVKNRKCWKSYPATDEPDITQLLMTIFEAGDFAFFRNLTYNYLLKVPLVNFRRENSGIICGQALNMFLEFSLEEALVYIPNGSHDEVKENNIFKAYNKKFQNILLENLGFMMKVIINMNSIEIDSKVISHNIKIKRPLGYAKILLVETLY